MKLAVTLLLTWAGTPCVYYGDEIGLQGESDPDCRRCFDWQRDHWNLPLLEHYQAMIRLRQNHPELRHGACQVLAVKDEALVFARYTGHRVTLVAVNRGPNAVTVPLPWHELPLPLDFDASGDLPADLHVPAFDSVIVSAQA